MMSTPEGQSRLLDPQIKLDTLVRLRWLAVAGQTVSLLVVHYLLNFPLPIGYSYVLVAASAWLNVILKIRWPSSTRISKNAAAAQLAYDIIQLGGLFYLTGGLGNPFCFLILAPVVVSATALSSRNTIILGALAGAVVTLLTAFHMPLPWYDGTQIDLPPLYLVGVWFSLMCSMFFMATYSLRVAEEARQLSNALAASDMVLAHQKHLSALDGLATAAAHELGTPLGTIYLTAKELSTEFEKGDPLREDAELVYSQAARCREILKKLTSLSSDADQVFQRMPISLLLADVSEPHRGLGIEINIKAEGVGPEPVGVRDAAISYGLGNLLENAVDFAETTVLFEAKWDDKHVEIFILDDGPGFAPDVLARMGEPYVSKRSAPAISEDGEEEFDDEAERQSGGGLGLGFFIAKTLLERSGGRVNFHNRKDPDRGALVHIRWLRETMDQGAQTPES
ncbi:Sensor histidine kinase RegB [Pseudovibrio sp. W64]|uniref:ActS/PrrB/RegB family redox-sensitive histidine kinase n=1 Tax=unclassified Pseudovibrio TaxID=2627060 RepID=UPI00071079B5|nr:MULTISPECIES: ActS/PrrB/RegB family redox-sensitive histidine kinase [unclassified Pseudovibrio]KZK89037.1 Sensor histidine kinase RegB [Pseudovibrio sp. Ad5]KZK89295.1 Sensor histidine kinase RegB [Pseudovibrio sp. W64]KZK95541.1 Sensor histidine kinase RegB [Pseudovibrio sp. Ad46]KZL20000.1 Sensor histidine kinase RegB [Pseudovibrio sp. WM33]